MTEVRLCSRTRRERRRRRLGIADNVMCVAIHPQIVVNVGIVSIRKNTEVREAKGKNASREDVNFGGRNFPQTSLKQS